MERCRDSGAVGREANGGEMVGGRGGEVGGLPFWSGEGWRRVAVWRVEERRIEEVSVYAPLGLACPGCRHGGGVVAAGPAGPPGGAARRAPARVRHRHLISLVASIVPVVVVVLVVVYLLHAPLVDAFSGLVAGVLSRSIVDGWIASAETAFLAGR